jgi:hypothetical protein
MPHGPGGAEHGLVLVAEVPGSILAVRGIVLFDGPIGRLAEYRPDEVQSLSKRAKLVNVQFREALDDNPQISAGGCVDEVGRLAIPFYCDDDPPVNCRVIAAPSTDIGRGDIACCAQPLRNKLSLIRSQGPGR